MADDATPKEKYIRRELVKHQKWAAALELDRKMSEEFEKTLKVTFLKSFKKKKKSYVIYI